MPLVLKNGKNGIPRICGNRERRARSSRPGPNVKRRVLERDNFVCWLCGGAGADTVDHVVPRSRGVGNKIAQRHIAVAQKECEKMFVALKDRDLAYLAEETPQFKEYVRDLLWAQEFARLNREEMMDRVMKDFSHFLYKEAGRIAETERINCHHNFTQKEHHFGRNVWLTRKGAIQVREGQYGVIPGSMGTRSYIVSGKGNKVAFESAPHGAGRRFSRTEARKRLTMADFDAQMKGIECRRIEALIDELPAAYKDIDDVMENAKELVNVHYVLRQILNVKGD